MEVTVQSFSAAWLSFMSPERFQASRVSRTNRGRSYHGIERRVDENKGRGLGSKLTFSSIHGCKLLVSVRVSASSCSNDIRQLSIMRRFAVHAHEMLNTAERQISCVCVCVCVCAHTPPPRLLHSQPTVLACRATAVDGERGLARAPIPMSRRRPHREQIACLVPSARLDAA